MKSPVHVIGMNGLGDNVFQRPFIRKLAETNEVFLSTPWPELYPDMDIEFVFPTSPQLRTQSKNLQDSLIAWSEPPADSRQVRMTYGADALASGTVMKAFAKATGVDFGHEVIDFTIRWEMDLPAQIKLPVGKKLAVIRPNTLRKEFWCPSRNPDPQYIKWAASTLVDAGYHVISIADANGSDEWIDGRAPVSHQQFHHGELSPIEIIAALQHSSMTVTGVNMMMPLALAAGTPLFIIFGGRGEFDSPAKLLDIRNDLRKVGWAIPDNFCRCDSPTHQCPKYIGQLPEQFFNFISRIQCLTS